MFIRPMLLMFAACGLQEPFWSVTVVLIALSLFFE